MSNQYQYHHLVVLSDKSINDFVSTNISTSSFWSGGGRGGGRYSDWLWLDGSSSSSNDIMWEAGEPNNSGDNENCIVANYHQHSHKWNDASCDTKFHFVCQSMPKGKTFQQLAYWFNKLNNIY